MVYTRKSIVVVCGLILGLAFFVKQADAEIILGAEQPNQYLPFIGTKSVGLMINHTSTTGGQNLLDFLLDKNVAVKKIFAVEHGFRGDLSNGEIVDSSVDEKTGLPIVSLYGEKKKPEQSDLAGIDLLIFDMQDVGCRFYTYISSLHYLMDAAAEFDVPLLILDRPNPNGDYIDGPVLDLSLQSFVGMHPIPVVHGCTVGELAMMINGEGWLEEGRKCELSIIPVKNYSHDMSYSLPIKPSPNLPNDQAIRLYPSLCFFEAAQVSVGRGTAFPFQVIAYPAYPDTTFSFVPQSIPGVSLHPIFEGKRCYGIDLRGVEPLKFTIEYFLEIFNLFENKDDFWKSKRWIDLLSGDPLFYEQVMQGMSAEEISNTWQAGLKEYKRMRNKYLLYPDFNE